MSGFGDLGSGDTPSTQRLQVLSASPTSLGLQSTDRNPVVYGVVFDWPAGEHTVSVVALSDGRVNLYSDSEFGVDGAENSAIMRAHAKAFVDAASSYVDAAALTHTYPLPDRDRVTFYLMTFDGVRVIDADARAAEGSTDRFSALFRHGQSLITRFRWLTEGDPKAVATPPKGALEGSYLNCLLTSMAKGAIQEADLRAEEPLPDLELLVGDDYESRAWIAEHSFGAWPLSAKSAIDQLLRRVRLNGSPFGERRGSMKAVHVSVDGEVPCVFDVRVAPFKKSVHVERVG